MGILNNEKKKNKIDRETAIESFDQFCEDWEIEEGLDLNEEERVDYKAHRDKIVKAIMKGRLVFLPDSSTFEYTISKKTEKHTGKTLTLKRPKGRTLRQSDRAKDGKNVEKTYLILAAMLGDNINLCDQMDMIDLKPLLAISSLFLVS